MNKFKSNPNSTKLRREHLQTKASRFDLHVQIENVGKQSVYRFFHVDDLLYSAVGLKEAFCWLAGFHSGFITKDSQQ